MVVPDIDGADGYDPQDSAEAFDETHNTDELGYPDETRSFEPDLFDDTYDATAAQGDSDEEDFDPDDVDGDDLDDDEVEEEEADKAFLDDDLEDEDDDLVSDEAFIEASGLTIARDEAPLELMADTDDAQGVRSNLSRRFESGGELSDEDVRDLGYAGRGEKET